MRPPLFTYLQWVVAIRVDLPNRQRIEAHKIGAALVEHCKAKGWHYRHSGLDPVAAHTIGEMGEMAVAAVLETHHIPHTQSPKFVDRLDEITQDFTVHGTTIGVKTTAVKTPQDALKWPGFLYPAKRELGESQRLLGYPDYLVQAAANPQTGVVWLFGYATRFALMVAPVATIHGKPTHKVPRTAYKPVKNLVTHLASIAESAQMAAVRNFRGHPVDRNAAIG